MFVGGSGSPSTIGGYVSRRSAEIAPVQIGAALIGASAARAGFVLRLIFRHLLRGQAVARRGRGGRRSRQVFPVCAPSLIDTPEPMSIAALVARMPLIHDDGIGPHEPRLGWPRWLRDAGANPSGPGLHFGDSVLALAAARVGEGVMLARRSIAQRMLDAGELVRPVAEVRSTDGAYHLVAPRGGPTGAAAAFAAWIAAEAERFAGECADQDAANAAISSGYSAGSGKRS